MIKCERFYRPDYPSFSSSLLEEIFRSFDDNRTAPEQKRREKQQRSSCNMERTRGCDFVDQWMENSAVMSEKFAVLSRRKPSPERLFNSSSTSSESSSGGGFFSSDAESFSGGSLKPIRTGGYHDGYKNISEQKPKKVNNGDGYRKISDQKPKKVNNDGGGGYHDGYNNNRKLSDPKPKKINNISNKTKSRAMKLYGDLKKVKQPISPGGKLSSFIVSLFNSGGAKKPKISPHQSNNASKSEKESTTATSCLSKTPSSASVKRSVRFSPAVSVIAEDSLRRESPARKDEELRIRIMERQRRVEQVARELLKNYKKEDECMKIDDEDEDECASCSSSDLFELENFTTIGVVGKYCEDDDELPVYETTHLGTNRAISSRLIL